MMQQLCTFTLDDMAFGIPVLQVQEVVRLHGLTRVPLAPTAVAGLANLRGQIVTVVDLRHRLGLPRAPVEAAMQIVLRLPGDPVSLLVDRVADVIEVAETDLLRPPETLQGPVRDALTATCRLPDRLLLVLDAERSIAGSPGQEGS